MPRSQKERGILYGPGDIVKDHYDNMLSRIGKTLWRGVQQLTGSDFGKGLFLGPALLVAAVTFTFAVGALTGIAAPSGATIAPTIGEALTAGFGFGMSILSKIGLETALIGGGIGLVIDSRRHKDELSPANAAKLAEAYARMRESPSTGQMPEQSMNTPEKNFRAKEMDRRARAAGASQLRQGYGPG